MSTLPVVSLAGLRSDDPADARDVAAAVQRAARSAGFFYLEDTGVDEHHIGRALVAAKRFFSLPDEVKASAAADRRHRGYLAYGGSRMDGAPAPDLKESFVYGVERPVPGDPAAARLIGPNRWPAEVPELRTAVYPLFLSLVDVGRVLARGIALALGLGPTFFDGPLTDPLARGSLIHYPPHPRQPVPGQQGVGAHTDFGLLTLLWQDQVGGLEVLVPGRGWTAVPPLAGTLVVNVGDLLARWSNDQLPSNEHRVRNHPTADRYSMAAFVDPAYDTVVDPSVCAPAGEPGHYPPVVAGEHVGRRFESAFTYGAAGAS